MCPALPLGPDLGYKGRRFRAFFLCVTVIEPYWCFSPRSRSRGPRSGVPAEERARGGHELHAGAPAAGPDPLHRHPRQRGLVPRHRVVAPRPAGALVGELRRQPDRARAGARAAARHRLARGQLGLQRPLGRDRERGLHRQPAGFPLRGVPRDRAARGGDRAPLAHPDRPPAHHRPLPGAGPERPAAGRRHRQPHRSRQVLAVEPLHGLVQRFAYPRALPPAQAHRPADPVEHAHRPPGRRRARAVADDGRRPGEARVVPRRRQAALDRPDRAVCVRRRQAAPGHVLAPQRQARARGARLRLEVVDAPALRRAGEERAVHARAGQSQAEAAGRRA